MSAVFLAECPHLSAADDRFAEKGEKDFFCCEGTVGGRVEDTPFFAMSCLALKKGTSFPCSPYFESLAFFRKQSAHLDFFGKGREI